MEIPPNKTSDFHHLLFLSRELLTDTVSVEPVFVRVRSIIVIALFFLAAPGLNIPEEIPGVLPNR